MMRTRIQLAILSSVLMLFLIACEADYHARRVREGADEQRLTVGLVQREIKRGMSSAGVIEALGSPNVISTDEEGRQVWVYDKMATDVVASGSSWLVLTSGAASKSQRTLTIVVKFDEKEHVRDFAYHATRF